MRRGGFMACMAAAGACVDRRRRRARARRRAPRGAAGREVAGSAPCLPGRDRCLRSSCPFVTLQVGAREGAIATEPFSGTWVCSAFAHATAPLSCNACYGYCCLHDLSKHYCPLPLDLHVALRLGGRGLCATGCRLPVVLDGRRGSATLSRVPPSEGDASLACVPQWQPSYPRFARANLAPRSTRVSVTRPQGRLPPYHADRCEPMDFWILRGERTDKIVYRDRHADTRAREAGVGH